jgi:hypothetical protein
LASRGYSNSGILLVVNASTPIEQRLSEALAECERLREENRQLRDRLGISLEKKPVESISTPSTNGGAAINSKSSPEEKLKLFRSLFRGRDDVYAVRWEGRDNGKAGYSPAHRRVWGVHSQTHLERPKEYFSMTDLVGVRRSVTDDEQEEDPWTLPPSRKRKDEVIAGPLPEKVRVVRSNLVFVEKEGLPSAMLNRLHRLAAFQNPEFYRAQAMRLSTFGKPRVIRCAEEFPRHVALPRGCLGEIMTLLESHKIVVELDDQRFTSHPIDVMFHGQLRPEQQAAADAVLDWLDKTHCGFEGWHGCKTATRHRRTTDFDSQRGRKSPARHWSLHR